MAGVSRYARQRYPDITIVVISGDAESLEHGTCRIETILAKPFTSNALLQALIDAAQG
jgi:CheY-like chemotaxis protein